MMGVFTLPFQGPYSDSDFEIYTALEGGTQADNTLLLGISFNRGRGEGQVTIKYEDLSGTPQETVFRQNEPGRMVAIPINSNLKVIAKITSECRGNFQIDTL